MINRKAPYKFFVLLTVICPLFSQTKPGYDLKKCDGAPTVPWAKAKERVIEEGPVEIPPFAKQLRLQGSVRIEVCVSESGEVVRTKLVSGHPMLVSAAIESAKKWRFSSDGAGPMKTILEIPFSLGISPTQVVAENKINDEFFAEEGECRKSLHTNGQESAIGRCKKALELAEKLPEERANERRGAYQLLGHAYLGQRKFEDALGCYRKELEIGSRTLKADEAELAYAYHDVAMACHALGRASDAAENYAKAEQTMTQAREHIHLEELKSKYADTLKEIREHYLLLLKQTGQTAAVTDLEKRIQSGQ